MWWKNHLGLTWNLMPVCYWCSYMFRLILFFRTPLLKYIWWLKYVLYFKSIKCFPIFFPFSYLYFSEWRKTCFKKCGGKSRDITILKDGKWWFIWKARKCLKFPATIFNYTLPMNRDFFQRQCKLLRCMDYKAWDSLS